MISCNLTIPRMKCRNCGSTHALLPDFIVPEKEYSVQAILSIAEDADKSSAYKVSKELGIDEKTVRRIVDLANKVKNNVILIYDKNSDKFKKTIYGSSSISDIIEALPDEFMSMYFEEFRIVFLYIRNKRKLYMEYEKFSI